MVSLTGKDADSTWLQIEFASGPDGKGWVNAGFVQAQGVENLPIVTEGGEVVGTGTPTGIPPTPTPTLVPAPVDNDSAENPIVRVTFAPTGTQTLIYNGDVSSPAGDAVAHIVGYVAEISEAELLMPEFASYRQGRWIGKAGLERQYEAILGGEPGVRYIEVDASGRIKRWLPEDLGVPPLRHHLHQLQVQFVAHQPEHARHVGRGRGPLGGSLQRIRTCGRLPGAAADPSDHGQL